MKTHPFYRAHNLRLHEIPRGVKCPVVKDWPNSTRTADDVDQALESDKCNKYGWILDDCHVVIDIDVHDAKANGYESLAALEAELGFTLESVCGAIVETPSGGRHYYFTKPNGVTFGKVFKDKYPGIDFINGRGKQVIAANSEHDVHEGKRYELRGSGELLPVPSALVEHLQAQRQQAKPTAPYIEADRAGDEFNKSTKGLALICGELIARGYTLRNMKGYWEWDRPGKTTTSKCSGHLGKQSSNGNYLLICFSLADPVFPSGESMTIFHAYAMLCHGGDHKTAASALMDRGFAVEDTSGVDLSFFIGTPRTDRDDDTDDEEFAERMVPADGLLRELFDGYWQSSFRRCAVMGLATSIAICQTLFGRKVMSWTNLALNDYHLILAPTASGKEAPLAFASKVLADAGAEELIFPEQIQSGNGLLTALKQSPCGIWLSDEFGYVLGAILDKKNKDTNSRAIGKHLLSLYSKSSSRFAGSAYAGKVDHQIEYPHLSVVGVSTGYTVFREISQDQVHDGLLGRIAFWKVSERPPKHRGKIAGYSPELVELVRRWHLWTPGAGNLCEVYPQPYIMDATDEAESRWDSHDTKITEIMDSEKAIRSAMWGRVSARSMKLAIVHRLARLDGPEEMNDWNDVRVEIEDMNWGIKIANWSANLACDLVDETVLDTITTKTTSAVMAVLTSLGGRATMTQLTRSLRSIDAPQIRASVNDLEKSGKVSVRKEATSGRSKVWVEVQ